MILNTISRLASTRCCTAVQVAFAGLMATAVLPGIAAADVNYYSASRALSYSQTSDAAPLEPVYWTFSALLSSEADNEVLSSALTFNRPAAVSFDLLPSVPPLFYYYSPYYVTADDYLAAYPATTYTLVATRLAGPDSGDVFLPADRYCPEIPAFSGGTFSRLQGVDPSAAFTGSINGFSLPLGANAGSANITLLRVGGAVALWSATLGPGETAFTIPAGVMDPASNYSIGITYFTEQVTPNAGFAAATSSVGYSRATNARFTSITNCDHFIEANEFATICVGDGQACGTTSDFMVDTCGLLMVEYVAPLSHCSALSVRIKVDGVLVHTTGVLLPTESSGLIEIGPVAPGTHVISLESVGVLGGCNAGIVENWGGTLYIHRCAEAPQVTAPAPAAACGGDVDFTVTATGTGPLSYQWRRNGSSIDPETNPTAVSSTLTVSGVGPADIGAYDCVVTSPCTTVTSAAAMLRLSCGCSLADIAGGGADGRSPDGIVDGSDFIAFVNSFSAGDVAIDSLADVAGGGADGLSPDGIIDGSDFIAFINAFAAGC